MNHLASPNEAVLAQVLRAFMMVHQRVAPFIKETDPTFTMFLHLNDHPNPMIQNAVAKLKQLLSQ